MNLKKLCRSLLDILYPRSDFELWLEEGDTYSLLGRYYTHYGEEYTYLFPYRDPFVQRIIWMLKYKGSHRSADICAPHLSQAIKTLVSKHTPTRPGECIIVPIPLSRRRLKERGWNQSELLGSALLAHSPDIGILSTGLLIKSRETPHQTDTHSRRERLTNLKDSLSTSVSTLDREHIYIILDDVTTTGATFKEARKALRKAGARIIYCIAIAH